MAAGSCYLFLGPELGEKKDAINALRASLTKQYGAKPEETSFYAGECEFSEIMSVALNGSLFADSRLIIVKNAELIKKKDEINVLSAYFASPQDDTTFILVSEQTKIESAIEKAFEKSFKNNKRIFWELFEERKTQFVGRLFEQAGFSINADAIAMVLELVENNTDALRQECTKIAVFLRRSGVKVITEEQIEKLLAHSKEETVFSLFSAIARGDFLRMIGSARALLAAQTAPQAMFGFLAGAFRKFRAYCALVKNGAPNDFDLQKIGISKLGKKDYINARGVYGDSADSLLSLTAEYDIATRAGSQHTELLVDMYLYKIYAMRVSRGISGGVLS